jgi:hypothetical protein
MVGNTQMSTFWDSISSKQLDGVLEGEVAAFEAMDKARTKTAQKVKRPRSAVQAPPALRVMPVTVAPVPDAEQVRRPSRWRQVKRELIKASVLLLLGAVATVYVQHRLAAKPTPIAGLTVEDVKAVKAEQEPVAPKSSEAAPVAAVSAPESARPAPEAVTSSEPAGPRPDLFREAREALEKNAPNSYGIFMPEACFGDPNTLNKTGLIQAHTIRFWGDPSILAQFIKGTAKRIAPGQVMWAERQPDGRTTVCMLANVEQNERGFCTNQTALSELDGEFFRCRQGEYSIEQSGKDWVPFDRIRLPRELKYRLNGSSLAQK